MSADTDALVQTVREGLDSPEQDDYEAALAALAALQAELGRLQNKLNTDSQNFELECRKAELERVKAERDAVILPLKEQAEDNLVKALAALREAEAEATRYATPREGAVVTSWADHAGNLRQAIAAIEGEADIVTEDDFEI